MPIPWILIQCRNGLRAVLLAVFRVFFRAPGSGHVPWATSISIHTRGEGEGGEGHLFKFLPTHRDLRTRTYVRMDGSE